MDHLDVPKEPVYAHQKVRFFGRFYDGGDFDTYPRRCRFTFFDVHNVKKSKKTPEDIIAFLQSWLFFGLLNIALHALDSDLVCVQDGALCVTTSNLHTIHKKWRLFILRIYEKDPNRAVEVFNVIYHLLDKTHEVLDTISKSEKPNISQLYPDVYFSFLAIHNYILSAVGYYRDPEQRSTLYMIARQMDSLPCQQMLARNWCPNHINHIARSSVVESLYYISNLDIKIFGDHSSCTKTKCLLTNSTSAEISPKHRYSCYEQRCSSINVSRKRLISFLNTGSVPVIQFNNKGLQGSTISVKSSKAVSKYVAVSHVWAHGLGNTKSNSLPYCQLYYLNEKIQKLYPVNKNPVAFWVDTICVPVEPIEAKMMALEKMRSTYTEADKVIVFDMSLETVGTVGKTLEECLIRVNVSQWMRRLWTLQEARLAREIHVQFSDKALNIDDALSLVKDVEENRVAQKHYDTKERLDQVINHPTLSKFALSLFTAELEHYLRQGQHGQISLLSMLCKALERRSTSHAEDEAICLGTLLGLDMKRLLSVREEERMTQMWKLINEKGGLNQSLVFIMEQKMEAKGLGWAPKTMLNPQRPMIISESAGKAVLTKDGLRFRCPGFILESALFDHYDEFIYKTAKGSFYCCTRRIELAAEKSKAIEEDKRNQKGDKKNHVSDDDEKDIISDTYNQTLSSNLLERETYHFNKPVAIIIDTQRVAIYDATDVTFRDDTPWPEHKFPWHGHKDAIAPGAICTVEGQDDTCYLIKLYGSVGLREFQSYDSMVNYLSANVEKKMKFNANSIGPDPAKEDVMNLILNGRFVESQTWCCM